MPSSPDEAEVLAANRAFYAAFARKDPVTMDRLWARTIDVACIHPGWGVLSDRDEVMASWRAILESPQAPPIRFTNASAVVVGTMACVVCTEIVPGAELVATNLFVKEGNDWRICHHHASPVEHRADQKDPPPGELLN